MKTLVFGVLVLLASGAAFADDLAEFRASLEHYALLGEQKAFALAVDPSGTAAWGYSSDQPSVEMAAVVALEECTARREEYGVGTACKLVVIGNVPLVDSGEAKDHLASETVGSPALAPRMADIQYKNQWIEGTEFLVATARDAQVWVAFYTKDGPHALVYVANATNAAVTFVPERIYVTAVQQRRSSSHEISMTTLSAQDYEKKERRKQAIIAGLAGASAAMASQPQPQTSWVQGTTSGRAQAYGPGGTVTAWGTGTYSGTITKWPTAQDYADANARTMAQTQVMAKQLRASFDAMASTLARTHTLQPGTFYGGIVRFKKQKANTYKVVVPFGGREYSFEFTRAD